MTPVTSAEHFQTAIEAALPTLVLFGSPTCPYCRQEKPLVEAFGAKYPRISTLFVDVTVWPEIASRRRVATVPTLVLYRDGKQIGRAEGFHAAKEIEKFAAGALS